MARDYFIQTTSLVPPRGVSVEMTEIRPLRPNQAIILPGVAVLGQGLKFEVRYILFLITITSINRPIVLFTDQDGHSRVDKYNHQEQFSINNILD